MRTINREELAAAMKAGAVTVVDALPPKPYAERHLPGAMNLVIEELERAATVLRHDAAIVVYSTDSACGRAPELAEALVSAGYRDVRTYPEGIADWAAAGLPLESGTGTAGDDDQLRALVERWAELERTQDADGFADLLTEQFTGIGPVGFVLNATQWADRHRDGRLVNHAFEVTDLDIARYGDLAVMHAVETQRTTARGHENNGSFRVGLTAIKDGDVWRIARIQLSGPMIEPGQRPPFAR
ncbi:DUF4440 domain-containing protein [Microlunatus parietis]|uniref:Rhodanese-related sulfurtransferase/ketosteroid isomerase-like protein n=1 Tax=Microlunatus parietis TaxID=682979 RepID=A0A7Y9LD37_9ACTN|nr:DUF4440 domain-containing protein [Microlunatus parietis]NYE71536.1 rhodanese-related sulfurtransferase/ketosteroid isomerase-like protein [Microlunatus parietis]